MIRQWIEWAYCPACQQYRPIPAVWAFPYSVFDAIRRECDTCKNLRRVHGRGRRRDLPGQRQINFDSGDSVAPTG